MNTLEYENYHEVKDHYENEFSYNTYPCTIPLDFPQVPLHWHSEMELIYVKKGAACISIDMQEHNISSGSIAIILPGHIHGIMQNAAADPAPLEYENIIFNLNMLIPSQGDDMTRNYFKRLLDEPYSFPFILTPDSQINLTMIACIDRADEICQQFPSGYSLAIRSCLYDFFYYLNSLLTVQSLAPMENKLDGFTSSRPASHASIEHLERIKTITKYIEQHYDEEITIQKMAELCNISHSHFMKFFKTYMGTSFVNYLNEYRLLVASRMLTTSDASITDIAGKCGFDNVSYFNRIFKKKYHLTPKQLR